MKKIVLLVLLVLLFPITVFAKTPSKEETLNIIRDINNVMVIDGVTIESTRVNDSNIYFTIYGQEQIVPYTFENNKFSFYGGYILLDENNKALGEPFDNEYAFFVYSILENKSYIPYNFDTYYSSSNIAEIINKGFSTEYKESTNTFGFSLIKDEESTDNRYRIVYNYYTDGEYPVVDMESSGETFENPATGNYNMLITIMLISVLCIGIYSYVNREKKSKI